MTYRDKPFTCSRCGIIKQRYGMNRQSGSPICKSCYLRDLDSPPAKEKAESIAAIVVRYEPQLAEPAVLVAIRRSVSNLHGLTALHRQLSAHPEVLNGSPLATKATYRLVAALIEQGATRVALPLCSRCDKHRPLVNQKCEFCAITEVACARCGQRRRVAARIDGQPLCRNCWNRDERSQRLCDVCGQLGRINARDSEGSAICLRCYRQPPDLCDECGQVSRIVSRNSGRTLCTSCYPKVGQPKRACGNCGRVRRTAKKATDQHPDLCPACWWEPIAVCSRCGNQGMCNGTRQDMPLCLRCRLADKVTDALTGPDGLVTPELVPLRDAVVAVDNPRSGHVWLSGRGVELLRALARGDLQLTHQAFDELQQSPSVNHLRAMLVALGLLAYRDPGVASIEAAIAKRASGLSPDNARIIRSFGNWSVLRRARRQADLGRLTVSSAKNLRSQLHEAARFLDVLADGGRGLADVTQADVDQWLASGQKARYKLRDFLVWAGKRNLCPRVEVPCLGTREGPQLPVDHQGRWDTARRLLTDDSIDPADRVAGALVVIYAQRLSDIARLTRSDVVEREGSVFLRIADQQVLMPEPLGGLLRQLPWRRQVGISGQLPYSEDWLFPGRQAGHHLHPEYLRVRLGALGVDCRTQRRAALLQLAAEVPAAVLADMLGLVYSTATKWVEWAGGNWTNYAAMRSSISPEGRQISHVRS